MYKVDDLGYYARYVKLEDNHWLWIGALDTAGYAQTYYEGNKEKAHRLSRHLLCGFDLNSGVLILHKNECHIRHCINPEHTYEGDRTNNTDDQVLLGNHNQDSKMECKNGHTFTKENTYVYTDKLGNMHRQCRRCKYNHKKNKDLKRQNELA